ncbi:hypothetical protein EAX61_02355 [Dokdonia sinensis]|uniref:SH3 domain-containing protein n=1 Tax=Dokdonia sinensis TaxID=2479847 RepID=A0A3M0GFI7_9FLAO|nr:hypothetical protein [Dokdonia sinensis]RMB63257.1 hypothetical protein EAX61_02355 [Dokdonia sinensis]
MKIIIKTLAIVCLVIVGCKENNSQEASTKKPSNPDKALYAANGSTLEKPESKVFYINAPSGLSLREGITLRSTKKLTLPYGAQVTQLSAPAHTTMTIDGITGDMVEVDYQGATGFVFNGYLTALAPPLKNESLKAYAQRVSTVEYPITVAQKQNEKGAAYGMTTTVSVPAKSWNEAYTIAQHLFELPKSLKLDLNKTAIPSKLENTDKRRKTVIDEVTISRGNDNNIERVTYTYALKDYKRSVSVKKNNGGFTLEEVESSN